MSVEEQHSIKRFDQTEEGRFVYTCEQLDSAFGALDHALRRPSAYPLSEHHKRTFKTLAPELADHIQEMLLRQPTINEDYTVGEDLISSVIWDTATVLAEEIKFRPRLKPELDPAGILFQVRGDLMRLAASADTGDVRHFEFASAFMAVFPTIFYGEKYAPIIRDLTK